MLKQEWIEEEMNVRLLEKVSELTAYVSSQLNRANIDSFLISIFLFVCPLLVLKLQLNAMGSKIGYPNKILNITQLDFDYQEVSK